MTEPDHFLSRWSRLKQDAKRDSEAQGDEPSVERVRPIEADAPTPGAAASGEASGAEAPRAPEDAETEGQQNPQIDLSSLPPIESIGAGTDIGAFLRKGVPLELTRAALRRAWTTDPTIRDFIGVAENQWDFATGSDLPGFGPLEASDDVRRMVEELFQQKIPAAEAAPSVLSQSQLPAEAGARSAVNEMDLETGVRRIIVAHPPSPEPESQVSAADNKELNIAMQQSGEQADSGLPIKRLHGRALPR
jgi:hypothetical protein